jgi:hypothetical protein
MLQIFYSFGMTLLAYTLVPFNTPTMALTLQPFQQQSVNQTSIANQIQASTNSQINIPLVDLGSLVFYSGNIFLDLMINFFAALPGMFNLLIDGFCLLFQVPAFFAVTIKLTIYVVLTVTYFIALMSFLLTVRSRGAMVQ